MSASGLNDQDLIRLLQKQAGMQLKPPGVAQRMAQSPWEAMELLNAGKHGQLTPAQLEQLIGSGAIEAEMPAAIGGSLAGSLGRAVGGAAATLLVPTMLNGNEDAELERIMSHASVPTVTVKPSPADLFEGAGGPRTVTGAEAVAPTAAKPVAPQQPPVLSSKLKKSLDRVKAMDAEDQEYAPRVEERLLEREVLKKSPNSLKELRTLIKKKGY